MTDQTPPRVAPSPHEPDVEAAVAAVILACRMLQRVAERLAFERAEAAIVFGPRTAEAPPPVGP